MSIKNRYGNFIQFVKFYLRKNIAALIYKQLDRVEGPLLHCYHERRLTL